MPISVISGVTNLGNATLTDPRPLLMAAGYSFETDTPDATPNVVTFNCNQTGSTINLATGTVPTASGDNHTVYRLSLTSGSLSGGLTDGAFYFVGTVTSTSVQLRAATASGTNSTGAVISITAATGTATLTAIGMIWNSARTQTFTAAAPYGRNSYVVGFNFNAPEDLSTGLFSLPMQFVELPSGCVGYLMLVDTNGHWARFKMADSTHLMLTPIQQCLLNGAIYTALPSYAGRSSASFNMAAITKVLAVNSTTASGVRSACGVGSSNIARLGNTILSGSGTIVDAMAALIAASVVNVDLGNSVYRIAQSIQFGDDGTNPLTLTGENATLFVPQIADGVNRFNYMIAANDIAIKVRPGASDSFTLTNTQLKGIDSWIFDTDTAATPATYNMSGCTVIGSSVTLGQFLHTSLTFVSATAFDQNGATLDKCNLTNTNASLGNPTLLTGCIFTSGGTGHGATITTPGTYTFSSAFAGYGADGTTNAAVYNNSGGAVTLVVPVGVALPTVRNGAGASTTLMRPNFNLTITNLTNSYVRIDDASDVQQSYDAALTGSKTLSVPYSETGNTWHVHIRRKGYAPRKILVTFTGSDMSFDGALVQRLNFSGTATYTGTTSSDCQISLNDPATDEARIDLQGPVTAQIIYNMFEDAIVGAAAISSDLDATFFQDPVGFQLLSMSSLLKLRRWHAGDTAAEAVGLFSQADNAPLDLTNGGVQFTGTPVLLTKQDVTDAMHDEPSTGVVTAAVSVAGKIDSVPAAILSATYEGAETVQTHLRITRAALAGKTSGGGTVQETFYGLDGTTPRIVSDNDGKDRTSVAVSGA